MSQLDRLLQQKMSRRQFLGTLLAGGISLFGLSALMGLLAKDEPAGKRNPGYGRRGYGP